MTATDNRPIGRALISVSDKSGLIEFAQALADRDVEILSTGGSAKTLREAGVAVIDVADVTGFPEIMGGRVKTLHPKIHGGILAKREDDSHRAAMNDHDIGGIDLVVVNLYPFEATVARGADPATVIENIDIGGPAMIRAAAKNHEDVTVLVDPGDYDGLLAELAAHGGGTGLAFRQRMAAKAFQRTGAYDTAITAWFAKQSDELFPEQLVMTATRLDVLRYGENPHQQAAFYANGEDRPGAATARQIQGKALSYNNINDTDAAIELVAEFSEPAIAIIKHANPCGVAVGEHLTDAYRRAFACDTTSAFGGIVAANRPLDKSVAEAITDIFVEVVIAPGADDEARAVFARKENLRLLLVDALPDPAAKGWAVKSLAGGWLVQNRDNARTGAEDLRVVTKRQPTPAELADMLFAFSVAKHVKSNAIVYAKDGATVGIGAGQMSRVDSARIAARKAEDAARELGLDVPLTQGSVVASDAFFPFADGLLTAAEAGATAIIQPGGSMRDEEVVAAADEAGLAMVFTGVRHFRH